jgi:hypothetical protein
LYPWLGAVLSYGISHGSKLLHIEADLD